MKRLMAILLAMILMTSAFVIPAGAQDPPEPGEFDYTGRSCAIWFNPIDPETGMTQYEKGEDGEWHPVRENVFFNGTVFDDMPAGVSYDPASHVLTLDNVNMPDHILWLSDMDYQFTINVKGSCSLGRIDGMSETVGQSITFVGDGTLDINKSKRYYNAICLEAFGFDSTINFGPYVTVNLYYNNTPEACAAFIYDSNKKTAAEGYTFQGEHNGTLSVVESDNRWEEEQFIKGYVFEDGDPSWMGFVVNNPEDPDGIYVAVEFEQTEGGEVIKTGYDLYHLVYNEAKKIYLYDIYFGDARKKTICLAKEFTEQEFKDAGYTFNYFQNDYGEEEREVFWNRCELMEFMDCRIVGTADNKRYAALEVWDSDIADFVIYYATYEIFPDGGDMYQFHVLRDQASVVVEDPDMTGRVSGYVFGNDAFDDGLYEAEGWRVTAPGHEDEILMLTDGEIYDDDSGEWIDGYRLSRRIYVESVGDYLLDKQFGEYGPYIEMTQQEVDDAGITDLVDGSGNRVLLYLKYHTDDGRFQLYQDAQGNKYAVDNDYTGTKVCTFEPIPELEGEYMLTPTDEVTLDQLTPYMELNGGIDYHLTLTGVGGLFAYQGGEPVVHERIMGDADMDGVVTILDATCIQRYLARLIGEDGIDIDCGDIDGNGLDTIDATAIQRWLAKVDTNNGIGGPMPSPDDPAPNGNV